MQKFSIGILAITFSLLSTAMPAAADSHCEGGSIKVGIVKSFTGNFSFFEKAGAQGEMLALEAVNEQGGIDGCLIEVITGDLKSDPALARQAAREVIAKGAQILFVPGDFDFGIGASQAAAEAGILAMSSESASVEWPAAAGGHFFVGGTTIQDLGVGQALFARDKGWKTAYVVTNEALSFFIDLEGVFAANFEGEILGRAVVAMGQPDYSAVISNIRNAGDVGVIVGNDFFPFIGTFIKQLRDAGIDTPVLGNSTYSSQALPELVGRDRVQEVYYASQSFYEGAGVDAATGDFVAGYQERFDTFPENVNAILGFWGGLLIADALRKTRSVDASALAGALNAQSEFALPGATLLRWVNQTTEKTVSIVGFDANGGFIEVDRFDPRKR
jgi:branched-chain amino acid transport system substrate-binding protein